MDNQKSELLEKLREQYDNAPFPRVPLERSPRQEPNLNALFCHSLITPYYLKFQKTIETHQTVILDAGCGTGYTSLCLAEANPGAKIVGIDLSAESVELAKQRLAYHGYENTEFHTLLIEELPQLGMKFDYINCDEVLYLLPEPLEGLHAMKSVLKPQGFIRANLHSIYQRQNMYRAQTLFRTMGLMDSPPGELEAEIVIETMNALKDEVSLKAQTWNTSLEENRDVESILVNQLLQGDKGFTVSDLFSMLEQANLEFVSMLMWRHWEVLDLFKDINNLPPFLALGLEGLSLQERLQLFELLHPIHRVLDFWCAHEDLRPFVKPLPQWDVETWNQAHICLYPLLNTQEIKNDATRCVQQQQPFHWSRYLSVSTKRPIITEWQDMNGLLPLWENTQTLSSLTRKWLMQNPVDVITQQPNTFEVAMPRMKSLLSHLESFLYILIEQR